MYMESLNLLHHMVSNSSHDYYKTLYKILKDGKLMSSRKTRNVKMFGWQEGSPYIFFNIQREHDQFHTFILNPLFLLKHKFYLEVGWGGEPRSKIINGRDMTSRRLLSLLRTYNKQITKFEETRPWTVGTDWSNEILVRGNVNLKSCLSTFRFSVGSMDEFMKHQRKIIKLVLKEYPITKMIIYVNEKDTGVLKYIKDKYDSERITLVTYADKRDSDV